MMDIKGERIMALVKTIAKEIPSKRPGPERDLEFEEALFEHEAAVELMHKLTGATDRRGTKSVYYQEERRTFPSLRRTKEGWEAVGFGTETRGMERVLYTLDVNELIGTMGGISDKAIERYKAAMRDYQAPLP